MSDRLPLEVAVFASLGRRLFGEHWMMATAKQLHIRRDTVNKIMRGKLALRPGLLLKMQLLYEEKKNVDNAATRGTERIREGGEIPHGPPDGRSE
jgi:hypothetical protein